MIKIFHRTQFIFIYVLLFLFPLFFLPLTQEFYSTNKLYLLVSGALILILLSAVELLTSKKISWKKGVFDTALILFSISLILSIAVNSPNKIQALLNPSFGPVMMLSLIILYFYLSRLAIKQWNNVTIILSGSALLLSFISIIFYFQPFKNVNLPGTIAFLKNPGFTPIGNLIDLSIFIGFFLVLSLSRLLKQSNNETIKQSFINYFLLIIYLLALSLTLYPIFRPNPNLQSQVSNLQLPPFLFSWYAAVETLKNPLTALFGVGVDNFASIFTRVKDLAYNQSSLWNIDSFNSSRSTLLHIFTETGLFGMITFGLILFSLIKSAMKQSKNQTIKLVTGYWLLVITFLPPSPTIWFLLLIILAMVSHNYKPASSNLISTQSFDLSRLPPIYISFAVIICMIVTSSAYFLSRAYAAELYFKKSLDGFTKNDAVLVYNNQRQAVILNPFIERFRTRFAQTNLIIANNVAIKLQNQQQTDDKKQDQGLTEVAEQDRQTIAQAIQASIAEAKAAVALNPQKANNWENLAIIYRNIINVAQEADAWTISAYQRAIISDPQNPRYRLNLGGVYYAGGNWDQASQLFQEAVVLKPDWANAYYNLAWSFAKKEDYKQAAMVMETTLRLINQNLDKADYDKAKKELEEFKKKIPKEEKETETTDNQQPVNLNLPSPPATQIEPKIELPQEASPEAR